MTDQELEALFNAVDDYLYSEVPGGGYPKGHCNPRHLRALQRAFLVAATSEREIGVNAAVPKTSIDFVVGTHKFTDKDIREWARG